MRIIIDRFEGKFAVCELPDGSFAEIDRVFFDLAKEGDVFELSLIKNEAVAEERKEYAKSLFERLKKK